MSQTSVVVIDLENGETLSQTGSQNDQSRKRKSPDGDGDPAPERREPDEIQKLLKEGQLITTASTGRGAKMWNHFSRVAEQDGTKLPFASCNKCLQVYRYTRSSGTDQFTKHTSKCSASQETQPLATSFIQAKSTLAERQLISVAAARFCAWDTRAFLAIEGRGLVQLVDAVLQVQAKKKGLLSADDLLPSRQTVSNYVTSRADKLRVDLGSLIRDSMTSSGGCITTDMWSEDHTKTPYLSLVYHCIRGGKMTRYLLTCAEFDGATKKTGQNIRQYVMECLEAFGIPETNCRNVVFVTDQGSNMVAAFDPRKNIGRTPIHRINCAAHIFNIVLANSVVENPAADFPIPADAEDVIEIISSCNDLVRYCRQTAIWNQLPRKLKSFVATRWNSRLTMLESIVSEYEVIEGLLSEREELHRLPGPVELLRDLAKFWKPFAEATAALTVENEPTIHLVAPWFTHLLEQCRTFESSSGSSVLMAYASHVYFVAKSKLVLDDIHKVAVFLNPASKTLELDILKDERTRIVESVRTRMSRFARPVSNSTQDEAPAVQKPSSAIDRLMKYGSSGSQTTPTDEVAKYLTMSVPSAGFNLLDYWRSVRQELPTLSVLAEHILCIQATSNSSERLFSDAGNVITDQRSRLDPEKLDDLLFLKWNDKI